MNLQQVFSDALASQQKGAMARAREGYRLLMIHQPAATSVLALMGLTYAEDVEAEGDQASCFLLRSLAIDPCQAPTWVNLGLALIKRGEVQTGFNALQNAISLAPEQKDFYRQLGDQLESHRASQQLMSVCRYVVHLDPNDESMLYRWGVLLHDSEEYASSQRAFRSLCVRAPSNTTYLLYLASSDQELEQIQSALSFYARVLRVVPDHLVAQMNHASLCLEVERFAEAIEDGKRIAVIEPSLSDAYYNLGLALQGSGHFNHSDLSYSRCIRLKPDQHLAYLNRGSVAFERSSLADCVHDTRRALILAPESHQALVNLGNAFKQENRAQEALRLYNRALDVLPELADALSGKGLILLESAHFEDALACIDEAIKLDPSNAGFKYNKAHLHLLRGEYSEGWPIFEWRWKTKAMSREVGPERAPDAPLWLGQESLEGKRILIWPEQGFGDALQFCRYIPELQAMGAQVVFEVRTGLQRLMQDSFPEAEVIAFGSERGRVDAHCPIMSLPLAFSTTLASIPGKEPYLKARPLVFSQFGDLLKHVSGLKVGLVWSGGLRVDQPETWAVNARRNIDLLELTLLKSEGVTFFSLQKGEPAESQLKKVQQMGWDGPEILSVADRLHDFADTAMILDALDLLISVDTSTAHLAAALGKPVWLLNRFDSCWRWLEGRDDSPWYPTIRLFRQDESRSWGPVIKKVAGALSDLRRSTLRSS